jgi:hypothetical protein
LSVQLERLMEPEVVLYNSIHSLAELLVVPIQATSEITTSPGDAAWRERVKRERDRQTSSEIRRRNCIQISCGYSVRL